MSTYAQSLIEARANAWEQAKSLLDVAQGEERELSAAETEEFARINSDIETKDDQVRSIVEAEERAVAANEARSRYESIVRPVDAPEDRSDDTDESAELRAVIAGEKRFAEFRALSKGTAAAGGNTVPTGFANELVGMTRDNSVAFQLGARIWDVDSLEDFAVPTVTGNGAAAQVSEGSQIAGTDPGFGQRVLKPRKFAQIVIVSYELAHSTAVDLMSFIAEEVAINTAEAFDAKAVAGTGTNEAQGIFVGASAAVTAASGSLTFDNLIDLEYSIVGRARARGVWVVKDSSAAALRKIKDTTNQYIWQPAVVAGQPDTVLGHPLFTDPNAPAIGTGLKSVAFLDPRAYGILRYNTVRVDVDNSFKFDTDQVAIRVVTHLDGAVVEPNTAKLIVHA